MNLVAGGGVDVEASLAEYFEDGGVRGGLHGVPDGEAVGVGESLGLGRLLGEPGEVVDVGGSAELFLDVDAVLRGEEAEGLDVVAAGGHRDDASAVGAADDRAGDRAGGEAADRRDPSAGADGFRLGGGGVSDCRPGDAEGGHLERVLSRVGVTPCTGGDLGKDSRGRLSPCRAT